jgi:hypothetical protein
MKANASARKQAGKMVRPVLLAFYMELPVTHGYDHFNANFGQAQASLTRRTTLGLA